MHTRRFSACHTTTNTTRTPNTHTDTHPTHHPTRDREKRRRKRRRQDKTEERGDKTEDTRLKTEDRREETEEKRTEDGSGQKRRGQKTEEDRREGDGRQKTEERGERREERRREKMKETREEIRRSRDEEKMKLNCLINCQKKLDTTHAVTEPTTSCDCASHWNVPFVNGMGKPSHTERRLGKRRREILGECTNNLVQAFERMQHCTPQGDGPVSAGETQGANKKKRAIRSDTECQYEM